MSGETKEVLGSNYGQNDVIINRLIDKMTLFDDNLMSLVFGQNIETTELLLRVIMERDIKVIDVRGQDELKNPVIGGRCITLDVHAIDGDGRHIDIEVQINAEIGLFVLISIAIYIYTVMGQTDVELPDQERKQEEEQDYFSAFADTYALTEREQEVLKMLLASDEEVQEIANRLYISRAMLYRYISSLNKKTDTNSRIGLIQFYYTWKPEKKADRDD